MGDLTQQLTAVDLGIAAVVGLSALLALARGGIREVFSIASWLGALVVAFAAFGQARPAMRELIAEPLIADAVALALVFLVPFIGLRIAAGFLSRRVNAGVLGPLDRFLGFAFGAARGVLVVAVAYLVLSFFVAPERQPDAVQQARLLPQVRKAAGAIVTILPENLANLAIATGAVAAPLPEPTGAARPGGTPAAAPAATPAPERGYTEQQRQGVDRLLPPPRP
ncbi:MAG TPA: CvpA family protein [Geminicoccaceae bacterium]